MSAALLVTEVVVEVVVEVVEVEVVVEVVEVVEVEVVEVVVGNCITFKLLIKFKKIYSGIP